MAVVFIVLTAAVVAAIGLVAVGRATAQLEAAPPRAVFDLEEAVVYVAEEVPFDVSAELSYDDVRDLLWWYLDYLEAKGVAADADELARAEAEGRAPGEGAGEPDPLVVAPERGPIVTGDDEEVAYVLGRAEEADMEVDDVAVVEVIHAANRYLEAIGAVGTRVPEPADPDDTAATS